jgi:hypothetical protein
MQVLSTGPVRSGAEKGSVTMASLITLCGDCASFGHSMVSFASIDAPPVTDVVGIEKLPDDEKM